MKKRLIIGATTASLLIIFLLLSFVRVSSEVIEMEFGSTNDLVEIDQGVAYLIKKDQNLTVKIINSDGKTSNYLELKNVVDYSDWKISKDKKYFFINYSEDSLLEGVDANKKSVIYENGKLKKELEKPCSSLNFFNNSIYAFIPIDEEGEGGYFETIDYKTFKENKVMDYLADNIYLENINNRILFVQSQSHENWKSKGIQELDRKTNTVETVFSDQSIIAFSTDGDQIFLYKLGEDEKTISTSIIDTNLKNEKNIESTETYFDQYKKNLYGFKISPNKYEGASSFDFINFSKNKTVVKGNKVKFNNPQRPFIINKKTLIYIDNSDLTILNSNKKIFD